jgi:hypothetical protein
MEQRQVVEVGDRVEVHTKFSDSWVGGFQIAEIIPEGYRVRRMSDGSILPGYTSETDVRRARSRARVASWTGRD